MRVFIGHHQIPRIILVGFRPGHVIAIPNISLTIHSHRMIFVVFG